MAGANFSTILLPGLMAVAIMFSGIAAVALPLAQEFGVTREIDDRVMCPLPVAAVAIEKIVFSALQSMIAAAIVFPMAFYVPATPGRCPRIELALPADRHDPLKPGLRSARPHHWYQR